MKRLLVIVLALALLAAGCTAAPAAKQEDVVLRVAAIKGPTGMGMAQLMEASAGRETGVRYEFNVVNAPEEIPALMISGQVDIAAVPSNMAALLYNKTKEQGSVQLAALNTLGVLYLLSGPEENIASVEDLRGKTIVTAGQGAVPEYALNYILRANGLEPGTDVTVDFRTEHAEVATLLISGEASVALLPEPQVTSALMQNADLKVALDMTQEWNKAVELSGAEAGVMTMGALIVSADAAQNHSEAIDHFLGEYEASVKFVNENPEEAGALIEKYGIMPKAAAAIKAIPRCNITCIRGEDMKTAVKGFLQILFEANPASVGGALPEDDFYYAS